MTKRVKLVCDSPDSLSDETRHAFSRKATITQNLSNSKLTKTLNLTRQPTTPLLLQSRHRALDRKVYFVSFALIWVLATFPPSIHAMKGQHIIPIKQMGYILIPFLVVLILIIYISYVAILIKVRGGTQPQGHGLTERNRKLTTSLLILTVVSLVTWMPFIILHFLHLLNENFAIHPNTLYFFKLLHYVNSLVNPIIYAFRIPKFRKAAIHLLHCRSLSARQREDIPMANV